MLKKQKLTRDDLTVQSFVTTLSGSEENNIKAGVKTEEPACSWGDLMSEDFPWLCGESIDGVTACVICWPF